jgi:hypothetical protein
MRTNSSRKNRIFPERAGNGPFFFALQGSFKNGKFTKAGGDTKRQRVVE